MGKEGQKRKKQEALTYKPHALSFVSPHKRPCVPSTSLCLPVHKWGLGLAGVTPSMDVLPPLFCY